ncbi:MAG: hypothetical protein IPM54_12045 [Polyangiaceae bacterium]|nr:hypothetical protein [Polyangiaceae bacterium]
MNGAMEPFYLSVVAFGDGRFAEAAEHARRAAELDPASSVFREAAVYLARVVVDGKSGVYVTGEAFGAFIRGGSNTRLYRATSAALGDVYSAFQGADLLDIGTSATASPFYQP